MWIFSPNPIFVPLIISALNCIKRFYDYKFLSSSMGIKQPKKVDLTKKYV